MLGQLASFLAALALVISGSMFTHAADFTHHHQTADGLDANDASHHDHHQHSDAPGEKSAQSESIHCGANILALVTVFAQPVLSGRLIELSTCASLACAFDRSTEPPPPRTISIVV
jgi:hypothetical protein